MKKSLWIIIGVLVIILTTMLIIMVRKNNLDRDSKAISEQMEKNAIEISKAKVTDSCVDEWDDYNDYYASYNLNDENRRYLLKDVNGYIYVYYLDENDKEFLYKKTTIFTDYLAAQDLDDLQKGIEVKGIEEVNKLLEDFE